MSLPYKTKSQSYISSGYKYAVDVDLEKFFDTVNQSKLIEVLSRNIKDGRVLSLIHKYLQAGVVVNHSFEESARGVPQGGPLSPLLSNIMPNELDKELENGDTRKQLPARSRYLLFNPPKNGRYPKRRAQKYFSMNTLT